MGGDRGRQIDERVEFLPLARTRDGQETLDCALVVLASRSEHDFPPLHNDPFILPASVTPERFIIPGIR
jgi:hypothetical protein